MDKQISIIETSKFRDLRVEIREYKGHNMVGVRQWVPLSAMRFCGYAHMWT